MGYFLTDQVVCTQVLMLLHTKYYRGALHLKGIFLPIKGRNAALFYGLLGFIGYFLLISEKFLPILIGCCLILLSIHEIGHVWALGKRGYRIEGIIITIFGPGVIQDRPVEVRDSNLIYLSGFFSLIIPFLFFIVYPNFQVFILLFSWACVLSSADIYSWWVLRKVGASSE